MPALDPRFYNIATYMRSEGDDIYVCLQGVRVYTVEVALVNFSSIREAFNISHSFVNNAEAGQDVISVLEGLRTLPIMIQKGQQLPKYDFLVSPFVDPDYWVAGYNYYFQGFTCKPTMHVDTNIEIFPPSLQAVLMVDAIMKYSRLPLTAQTSPPADWVQMKVSGWNILFPPKDSFAEDTATDCFGQQESFTPFYRWAYHDSLKHFASVDWTNYGYDGLVWKGGVKVSETGRLYYYGEEGNDDFPFRSLEPVPGSSREFVVTRGANEHISGTRRRLISSAGRVVVEPPEKKKKTFPGISPLPNALAALCAIKLHGKRNDPYTGEIDGSWKVAARKPRVFE